MELHFLIPGPPDTRTGGYEYDRRIVDGLRSLGWDVHLHRLADEFPFPPASALAAADAVLTSLPEGARALVDGLALGAMPEEAARHAGRVRLIGLVHHPLAYETGLDAAVAARLHESERRALAAVRHVIVTSRRTEAALAAFAVSPARITVIEPGTDPSPLARGSDGPGVSMVCIASLSPRKGHLVLLRALAHLRDRDWHLTCVGNLDREPAAVQAVRDAVRELALEGRVTLAGEADAAHISAYYDGSDLFVLPTFYEGYGMVIAEALAWGLPVISTPTGAIAELVTPDCGVLVEAGDVDGWVAALTRMLDPAVRASFRHGASMRRLTLPTWEAASRRMAQALQRHG